MLQREKEPLYEVIINNLGRDDLKYRIRFAQGRGKYHPVLQRGFGCLGI